MNNRQAAINKVMDYLKPAMGEVNALNAALVNDKWNKAASLRLRTAINDIGKAKADLRRCLRQADQKA